MGNFKCHGCGACCMTVGDILSMPKEYIGGEEFKEDVDNFPYKPDKNGWCEKLGSDMRCTVYENRPALCRVDAHFDKTKGLTKEEYHNETTKACKFLMGKKLNMSNKEIDEVYASF